jgi:F0F1-type ATP synthase delta subunit
MSITPEQKNTLNKHLVSKDSANSFIEELNTLDAAAFKNEEDAAKFTSNFMYKYEKLLEELKIKNPISSKFSVVSADILNHLLSQDYMRLTLSFSPSNGFLSRLQGVVQTQLNETPMFDVELDKSIVGGALVDYKGIHLDLSLANLIEKYLKDNSHAILSEL